MSVEPFGRGAEPDWMKSAHDDGRSRYPHRIIPLSYAPAFIRGRLVVGAWTLADTRPVDETVP